MPETPTAVFLAGVAAVALFARYYLKRTDGQVQGRSTSSRPREVTDDMIGIIRVMLPHVPPDVIRADLERTRSIDSTVTRLLNENSDATGSRRKKTSSASKDSLLSRYDLQGNEDVPEVSSGWHESRELRERQLSAQRRAMILKARQNLLAQKE